MLAVSLLTVAKGDAMADVPQSLQNKIRHQILADFEPTLGVAFFKVGAAILAGGVLSLFVCGQFGIGFTPFALQMNHQFHGSGAITCALICGALFAVVPLMVLRFLTSSIQFRVLLTRKYPVTLIWLAVVGGFLSYHGNVGTEYLAILGWYLAANLVLQAGRITIGFLEQKLPVRSS